MPVINFTGIFIIYLYKTKSMSSQELIEELKFNDRWLTEEYKNSEEYREYLSVIFNKLEQQTK